MNHFVISAALSSFIATITSLVVYLTRSPKRANRLLALYWLSIAFWSFFVGTQPHSIVFLNPFWWGWLLHLGCTFIPVLLFHFTVYFTEQKSSNYRLVLTISYGMTLLFNALNFFTKAFTNGTVYRGAYAYPKPSQLYPLYFFFFVILVSWSFLLFIRYLPKLTTKESEALKFMLLGQLLAYLGGMDNFLIMADVRLFPLYPYGLYLVFPYVLFGGYAISRVNILNRGC